MGQSEKGGGGGERRRARPVPGAFGARAAALSRLENGTPPRQTGPVNWYRESRPIGLSST
jgi:hypothetical protein